MATPGLPIPQQASRNRKDLYNQLHLIAHGAKETDPAILKEAWALAKHPLLSRRQFMQQGALSAGYLLGRPFQPYLANASAGGTFLGLVEFQNEGEAAVGQLIATELDQRRYTDLSRISAARMWTRTDEFFVRTGASALLPSASKWTININGLVKQPSRIDIRALGAAARPMGLHLLECAGNVRVTHFGLISVSSWTGVPMAAVLKHAGVLPTASQVHVSGFDQYASPSATSIPGASWIFPVSELTAAGAFLATGMNDKPLTAVHGAPVRLVVPNWYGCCCIKWVQSITLVDDTVEATSQMREYAVRTLQDGSPVLAKDFAAPVIDHAALPTRVEKWRVGGKLQYRISGLLWGGVEPVKTLQIRFHPDEEFVPVDRFRQSFVTPWTLWGHTWSPAQTGLYALQLGVGEPRVQARKMDAGYYVRFVQIDEVE